MCGLIPKQQKNPFPSSLFLHFNPLHIPRMAPKGIGMVAIAPYIGVGIPNLRFKWNGGRPYCQQVWLQPAFRDVIHEDALMCVRVCSSSRSLEFLMLVCLSLPHDSTSSLMIIVRLFASAVLSGGVAFALAAS
jgi:hypothetical protein